MIPPWIETLADRAGPFAPTAVAFATERGVTLARGKDGLRELARWIDDHLDGEGTDEGDRRFVEGAGAVLALLLLDHLGQARHRVRDGVHRLALGNYGFFDPFAAIEASFDAERPRTELARCVEQAEAEARGDGPIACVVRLFDDVLREMRPDLAIEDQFDLEITLPTSIRLDLARIARLDASDVASRRRAATRLLALLPGSTASDMAVLSPEELATRLLPRPVGPTFLDDLSPGSADRLVLFPAGHGVSLSLVLEYADRARYLRRDELSASQLDVHTARRRAIANLAARSGDARFARIDESRYAIVVARSGDGLDAARLFLPTLHSVLAEALPPPIVAAIPHRDRLLAVSGNDAEAVTTLKRTAAEEFARAPHAISSELFLVGPDGPSPYEPR